MWIVRGNIQPKDFERNLRDVSVTLALSPLEWTFKRFSKLFFYLFVFNFSTTKDSSSLV
jgi:hypothetical protein